MVNNEQYQEIRESWNLFVRNISVIEKFLIDFHYDGYSQDCNYIENLRRKKLGNVRAFFGKETPEENIFLLPNEFHSLSLEEIIVPLPLPEFPKPLAHPILNVDDEYTLQRDKIRSGIIERANHLHESINKKKIEFIEIFSKLQIEGEELKSKLALKNDEALARLIYISNLKHSIPPFLRGEFSVRVDSTLRIALIELKFPDYSNEAILVGYTGTRSDKKKFASDAHKKKLVKQCLFSIIIRAAFLASRFPEYDSFDTVVINVEQDWFDPATGQPRNGLIASLQANVDYLRSLDLSKLDPESCFKYLKGIVTPSLQNVSPIRPIFVINKEDERFINRVNIDSELEPESNLAAMPWEDFEQLVAQLFEWEFSQNGVEVKVTRASRDRGVDAVLFDPDPLKGGKYVLQAKRYTRTVDVSAVRDLYGTVMNEGANRGILISTSSYGPDSYEFAKDKPISLVDGQNLLVMLQKHGKKFRIDIEEARRLNNDL